MNSWERLKFSVEAGRRAWKAGPGAFSAWESEGGHEDTIYSPEEYGNYLLTSNAVFTCSKLRAESLSSIPFKAYMLDKKGKKIEAIDHTVTRLLKKVNPYWTSNRLLNMSELSLCLWGKCYWAVERGESTKNDPQEIWWMKPTQVKIHPDPINYIKGFEYWPVDGSKPIWFDPWEVIWFRFPNPLDEYSGLSPVAAARLAADIASSAGKSNKYLFDHGYQMGGIITPRQGVNLTSEQAKEIEVALDKRFKGVDKAHRWGVFRFEAEMKQMAVTPKDAEFLGALGWSLEEVARAYMVPLDMIGGQRTYENVKASDRAFWMRTMMPEGDFVASELTEQFLPMFGTGRPDVIEADYRKIPALQDDEAQVWIREQGQIQEGAIMVNEWRATKGLDPVPWGEVWWAPMAKAPVGSINPISNPSPDATGGGKGIASNSLGSRNNKRLVEFGSDEHERLWKIFERAAGKWEKSFGEAVKELFERQKDSILAKLKLALEGGKLMAEATKKRSIEDVFNLAAWIKKFRVVMRVVYEDMVGESGQSALEDLGISLVFNLKQPEVIRFIEIRTQRFAKEVNETTWEALKKSLAEGIDNGEGLDKLEKRVEEVMAERIRISSETIARTEVIGAMNGGTFEGWKQSGVVNKKSWLAALDGRERDSHREAHIQYQNEPIDVEENFQVGNGSGPTPGQIGLPEEDINCRCTMVPVMD